MQSETGSSQRAARAVHASTLQSMPDAAACTPAGQAGAGTGMPMNNLRMHLEQLALERSGASAAAPAAEGVLLLLSPAPACGLDLMAFLRLGAPRPWLQPQQLKECMEHPGSPMSACRALSGPACATCQSPWKLGENTSKVHMHGGLQLWHCMGLLELWHAVLLGEGLLASLTAGDHQALPGQCASK